MWTIRALDFSDERWEVWRSVPTENGKYKVERYKKIFKSAPEAQDFAAKLNNQEESVS